MPSAYLSGDDLVAYGVPNATAAQITQASALIDAYLRRPEGMVWMPDSAGQPCYMAAMDATMSFTLGADIAPGAAVPVQLTGPTMGLQVGDVVIVDREDEEKVEACVIASVVGPNGAPQIAFQNVMNSHSADATVELGLLPEEQRYVPDGRPITFISRAPLMRVISGIGRYGYGRRGDSANYNMDQFNLLAAVSKFGGPPAWELFAQSLYNSWDMNTGQVWVPAGIMLAYYSEVKLRYIAGFQASNLPAIIKQACATIITNATSIGGVLPTNFKKYKAGDTQVERIAASLLDDDIRASLLVYQARAFA